MRLHIHMLRCNISQQILSYTTLTVSTRAEDHFLPQNSITTVLSLMSICVLMKTY